MAKHLQHVVSLNDLLLLINTNFTMCIEELYRLVRICLGLPARTPTRRAPYQHIRDFVFVDLHSGAHSALVMLTRIYRPNLGCLRESYPQGANLLLPPWLGGAPSETQDKVYTKGSNHLTVFRLFLVIMASPLTFLS